MKKKILSLLMAATLVVGTQDVYRNQEVKDLMQKMETKAEKAVMSWH